MKILVTGAGGFVGRQLVPVLAAAGWTVVAASRTRPENAVGNGVRSPELGPGADWRAALDGADAVVHLAGRAHVGEVASPETEALYRRINAEGTRALARQAAAAGVSRFVFVSSCHAVAAESADLLTETTVPRPVSAYGRSKLAAEAAVREELGGAFTILRPPLVYGPGNLANFARLLRWVRRGVPLPIAAVRNRRSFIGVQNLADAIRACLASPAAAGRTYFPSDGEDVSSAELVRRLAAAGGRTARLFAVPAPLWNLALALPGSGPLRKLTASLFVDAAPLRAELRWTPPLTLDAGLRAMGSSLS